MRLSPSLAFNMNKHNTSTHAREKADFLLQHRIIPKHQPVMCTLGEIDCLVHVLRHAEKWGGDFRPVVDEVAAHYLEFLKYAAREHPVYVWGAVPTQKDNSPVNPDFPYYGTEVRRNLATEYFNQTMKALCEENGFTHISIFDKLITSDYRTKSEYIADGCHLSQKAWEFAREEFRKHGIDVTFRKGWPDTRHHKPKGRIARKFTTAMAILRYHSAKIFSVIRRE